MLHMIYVSLGMLYHKMDLQTTEGRVTQLGGIIDKPAPSLH